MTIRICNMITKIQNTTFELYNIHPATAVFIVRQLKFTHIAITQRNVTTSINITTKIY